MKSYKRRLQNISSSSLYNQEFAERSTKIVIKLQLDGQVDFLLYNSSNSNLIMHEI